ncbi:MAG TPA: electron transport complex subunit RsxC, partial [Thiopseudomonas sp.]|nr:electron transport complex subunit RsxC [Thiopseudomonas sp.]
TDELKAQVEQLTVGAAQAKQALAAATAAAPAPSKPADDDIKRLKIAASMAQVALRKAQKQLDTHGTDELKTQVEQLTLSAEQAKQALAAATAAAPTTDAPATTEKPAKPELSAAEQALKKAKIEMAMKRAALRKAERNEADTDTLAALQAELTQAEHNLAELNQS